jgi:hypothetical protein
VLSTDNWNGEFVEIDDQPLRPCLLKVDAFNRRQNVDPSGRYANLKDGVRRLKIDEVGRNMRFNTRSLGKRRSGDGKRCCVLLRL